MKKFELTANFKMVLGRKLFQIKALIDIEKYGVKAGDLGGWVEKEENLSHEGNAWVFDNAQVSGNAQVFDNAQVSGDAFLKSRADILYITGLGTAHRTTTAFRCKNGEMKIVCGCFFGNLEAFKKQVISTRTGKVKDEYLKFAELIEIYFRGE